MGADRRPQAMSLADWRDHYPDLAPETIGLRVVTILGVPAVLRYRDDDSDDFYDGHRYAHADHPVETVEALDRVERKLKRFDNPTNGDTVTGERGTRVLWRGYLKTHGRPRWDDVEANMVLEGQRLLNLGADLDLGRRILEARAWFGANAQGIAEVWT